MSKFNDFLKKVGNTFEDVAGVGSKLLKGTPAGTVIGTIENLLSGKANDNNLTPEQKQKAQELKQELELSKIEFEKDIMEAQLQDVQHARDTNISLQTDPDSSWYAKAMPYLIDFIITIIWSFLTLYLTYEFVEAVIKGKETQISDGIWGIYTAVSMRFSTIIDFHRGSSMGSKQKDKLK